jgi:short-subunit dehydrogenase
VQIAGTTVVLTGASGGLGQAIARDLHARGATLLLIGRRAELLDGLADELERATPLVADLSEPTAVEELSVHNNVGEADILIANAGIPAAGVLQSFTVEEIDRTLDVNLRSAIVLARGLLPAMLDRGRGHLLFVSSISGKTAVPGDSLYHATKYGLRGFAAGLRADLHGTGVGVSCVFPGFIRGAGIFADSNVKIPPGIGTRSPNDVARAVARAIERNLGEVEVASVPQRVGVLLGGLAPELSARVVRLLGGRQIAQEMGEALRDKR